MIVKTFLFALLFSLSYLENADAYLEKSPSNDIFQQESISELETLQEKIAEQEHPQQWRRSRRRRRPFPRYPYLRYPVPVPPLVFTYNSPYCNYHPSNIPWDIRSPLLTAICNRSSRQFIRNMIYSGARPWQIWVTGETPLMVAAQTGNFGLVRMLVEEFDVNWRIRDQWGHTAADWAYKNGYHDIGDYLYGF